MHLEILEALDWMIRLRVDVALPSCDTTVLRVSKATCVLQGGRHVDELPLVLSVHDCDTCGVIGEGVRSSPPVVASCEDDLTAVGMMDRSIIRV